jgi:CDP-diacylglycerol--glycerol-3-phosphate 3-phosphatidyltransferase
LSEQTTRADDLRWQSWANAVTLFRLASAPVCAFAITRELWPLAALLFVLAVLSDLADGRLARRASQASAWGGLLDHATDATFVTLGLIAVGLRGEVPVILPALVAAAFIQYTADSKAVAGRPLRASRLGRWNGIAYFVVLGIPLIRDALGMSAPSAAVVWWIGTALVASTVVSMGDRAIALLLRAPR